MPVAAISIAATCCGHGPRAARLDAAPAGCRRWPPRSPHDPRRTRHCILLWMSGGPSQTDTFDMKPGHANGGEFKEIATQRPGPAVQRAPAEAGRARRPARGRPLAEHQGRRPRPRHAPGAHRPSADGRRRVSVDRLLAGQAAGRRDRTPLPSYVSVAPPQQINPAAFGPGFLGAELRAGDRRPAAAAAPPAAERPQRGATSPS